MKKLLFVVIALPILSFGQIGIVQTDPSALSVRLVFEKPLDEQYIDWCNADSNKIIVGWNFILDEGGDGISGWTSTYEVFEAKYAPKDRNYIRNYPIDFSDPKTVYYYWERQQKSDNPMYFKHQAYKRAEPIRKGIEPTFKGFVLWKKKQQLTKEDSVFIHQGELELQQITKQNKN